MRTPETSRAPFSVVAGSLSVLALLACHEEAPPGPPYCPGVAMELVRAAPPGPFEESAEDVSVTNIELWIERLTSPELRGRHPTSTDAQTVAAFLAAHMSELGLAPPFREGSFCQAFPVTEIDGFNVVGHLPGRSEGPSRKAVLLGAHYDGQGVTPARIPYPGADDNASGVAALLEVARLALRKPWPFDLVFMATGAEEAGMVGATTWARQPTRPVSDLLLAVNLDMVGRPWPGDPEAAIGFEALGDGSEALAERLAEAGAAAGIEIRRLTELFALKDLKSDSDVYRRYAPTLYLSTGLHEDHHQPTDTPDKLDVEQIARTVRLVLSLLESLAV